MADALAARGVEARDVCALIFRHHPRFYPLYLAVSAVGAVPAVLAYPNARLHPLKFTDGLRGMAARSGLDWLLTEAGLEPVLRPLVTERESSIRGILFPLEDGFGRSGERPRSRRPAVAPSDPCLLQHSSGTTGLQKAVALSHTSVLEHVRRYAQAIAASGGDRIVSWLPLYHDMGLVAAFHLPLACGIPTVQLDPFEWVAAPELLLQAISEERGTLTWLPNFAYNLLADRAREQELENVRLDTVRMFINCSEAVRADSHERFLGRFRRYGADPAALAACYAMAETTFAATQTRPGRPARTLAVDREGLASGAVLPAADGAARRLCVSSGAPIEGCEIRIVSEDGAASTGVGELVIRSGSMFDGYRNDPEATARAFRDGWYHSGDLGFRWEGEYYVIGRKKDLIIVAGRNIYPEDVEDAVSGVPGVIAGRAVAFGADDVEAGTERVCVIAETRGTDPAERAAVASAIRVAGMAIDVTISDVYLAPPRWLIKSSAGKPGRKANKQRALDGELAPVSFEGP